MVDIYWLKVEIDIEYIMLYTDMRYVVLPCIKVCQNNTRGTDCMLRGSACTRQWLVCLANISQAAMNQRH